MLILEGYLKQKWVHWSEKKWDPIHWDGDCGGDPEEVEDIEFLDANEVTLPGEYMARGETVYGFMGCSQWSNWMVRPLEGTYLGNWWQRYLGKNYLNRPLYMGKECKNLCFPCKSSPKVNIVEEDFIIKWIRWQGSISFFSHPYHGPLGPCTEWPCWQGRRLCVGSATWTSTHPGWSGYSHSWMNSMPSSEADTESPTWHHSLGWSTCSLVLGWVYWTTCIVLVTFHSSLG